ncbi:MAG: protein kinase [Planctomycetota bacterium]|jgi:serine/threonine protein kinase/DNA-directed RNA polymerase subunit RPC12/RpoP|nr:protein kinase [Planctomycetota bacterium]
MPETARVSDSLRALTDRHVAGKPIPVETEEFTPTSSPLIDSQGAPRSLTPRPLADMKQRPATPVKPAPVVAPEPVQGGETRHDSAEDLPPAKKGPRPMQAAPGGSQVAFDLFDAIEREIEHEREAVQTIAQDVGAHQVSCPVCSHRFNALDEQDSIVCPKCGSDVTATARYERESGVSENKDPMIGATIRGCEVDRKIGEGGMGSVYHARQLSLDRSVAIKVLPPELKRDKKFLKRFEQEAKSLARINHANIMHVYDFGEDDLLGIYFMVMEFVDGLDLAEILRQKRRLPALEVLDMLHQSALGLEQASEKGVVHRDIKPDNLMVTAEGVWKVSDFGLAKHVDALTQVTRAGIRVGTPAFMSPEQCDGKPLDYHSDIYSLGVTAYVCLTGRLPFDGESPFAIMLKHKTQLASPVSKHLPEVDPEVNTMVMRMLSKDPQERATNWGQLIGELEGLLEKLRPGALRRPSGLQQAPRDLSPKLDKPLGVGGENLPPIPDELMSRAPELSPAAMAMRDGGVTTSRRARMPSSDDTPAKPPAGKVLVAQPAGKVLPDSAAVGSMFDAFEGGQDGPETVPTAPAPAQPLAPEPPVAASQSGLQLAPLPDQPAAPSVESESEQADAAAANRRRPGSKRASSVRASGPDQRRPTTSRSRRGESDDERLVQADERARQRGREAQNLEKQADAFLKSGKVGKAYGLYRAAVDRCQDFDRKSTLMYKADQARKAVRKQRSRRLLAGFVFVLLAAVVGLWQGGPYAHGQIANYEKEGLVAQADLERFIDKHKTWQARYSLVFRKAYDLAAVDQAQAEIDKMIAANDHAAGVLAARKGLEQLQAALDGDLDWVSILAEAREWLEQLDDPGLVESFGAIRDRAKDEVGQRERAMIALEQQLNSGAIADAVVAAEALRGDTRLGVLAKRLPWPVRVEIKDPQGRTVPGVRILVDGIKLPADESMAYRLPGRAVRLEVTAVGYIRAVSELAAGGEDLPPSLAVVLHRGRSWEVSVPVHGGTAPWAHIYPLGEDRIWLHGIAGIAALKASDGTVIGQSSPPPSGNPAWTDMFKGRGERVGVSSEDGNVFALNVGAAGIEPTLVARLDAPVLDFLRFQASFRDGVRMFAAVIQTADGGAVLGIEDGKEVWRLDGLQLGPNPMVLHRQARLLVLGRQGVSAVEEDGRSAGSLTLDSVQTGTAVLLGGESLLVAGSERIRVVRVATEGAPLTLLEDALPLPAPLQLGLVGDDTHAAAVLADRTVLLCTLSESGNLVAPWVVPLPEDFARPVQLEMCPLGPVVADDKGRVAVFASDDGRLIHSVDHDAAVLAATVQGERLIVYGADGRAVAYELITR